MLTVLVSLIDRLLSGKETLVVAGGSTARSVNHNVHGKL
jgi:hypothetical protein